MSDGSWSKSCVSFLNVLNSVRMINIYLNRPQLSKPESLIAGCRHKILWNTTNCEDCLIMICDRICLTTDEIRPSMTPHLRDVCMYKCRVHIFVPIYLRLVPLVILKNAQIVKKRSRIIIWWKVCLTSSPWCITKRRVAYSFWKFVAKSMKSASTYSFFSDVSDSNVSPAMQFLVYISILSNPYRFEGHLAVTKRTVLKLSAGCFLCCPCLWYTHLCKWDLSALDCN